MKDETEVPHDVRHFERDHQRAPIAPRDVAGERQRGRTHQRGARAERRVRQLDRLRVGGAVRAELADGTRTFADIAGIVSETTRTKLTEDDVRALVRQKLEPAGILGDGLPT